MSSLFPTLYAGFWRRLLAVMLDSFMLSIALSPFIIAIFGREYYYWTPDEDGWITIYSVVDFVFTKILALFLIIVFWVKLGATPGKLLLDCQIVDADTLQPITRKQALLRCFYYLLSALPFYLGFVWIAVDKRKQGLHDKLANTVVLYQPEIYADIKLDEFKTPFA